MSGLPQELGGAERERDVTRPRRLSRSTMEGQEQAASCSGRVLHSWLGADTHAYRLRVVRGNAVVERSYYERGPWRRMPYAQGLVEELAMLAAGRQWREAPLSSFVEGRP